MKTFDRLLDSGGAPTFGRFDMDCRGRISLGHDSLVDGGGPPPVSLLLHIYTYYKTYQSNNLVVVVVVSLSDRVGRTTSRRRQSSASVDAIQNALDIFPQ